MHEYTQQGARTGTVEPEGAGDRTPEEGEDSTLGGLIGAQL